MKRRSFLTTTGLVGAGFSTGMAATASLLTFPSCEPFDKLDISAGHHQMLEVFANRVSRRLKKHTNGDKLTRELVNPVEIISIDESGNNLCFKNASNNFVRLEKDGHRIKIKINNFLENL